MFLDMESQMCSFKSCQNSSCQFRHEKHIENLDEESEDVSEDAVEQSSICGKQRHLCYIYTFESRRKSSRPHGNIS